jgi:hypothetical protein
MRVKSRRLVAQYWALYLATDRGDAERTAHLHQQHAQPVADLRHGQGRHHLLTPLVQLVSDTLAALHESRRVLAPSGRLVRSVWRSVAYAPGFRVLAEALACHIGAAQAALPPLSLGDGRALRALVMRAGFREVRGRADVKRRWFPSAEFFVRSVVASRPTMGEALVV